MTAFAKQPMRYRCLARARACRKVRRDAVCLHALRGIARDFAEVELHHAAVGSGSAKGARLGSMGVRTFGVRRKVCLTINYSFIPMMMMTRGS
jgi:hypothetical protein